MRIGTSQAEPAGPEALGRLREDLQRAADDGFASAWMSNIFGLDALTALAVYSFDRPARHMREYLSILLPLLDGEPASFQGETMRAGIGLSTPRPGRVPVLLAALAPHMLRLAGQRTDGTVLWMTGPATVRDYVVPAIREAAQAAGRPSPRVVCILPVCVTDDPDGARARANRVFAIYGQLPSYRAMLDREGAKEPGDVAITGNEDAVAAQISALAEAGVTDFVAGEYAHGDDQLRTRALLKSLAQQASS